MDEDGEQLERSAATRRLLQEALHAPHSRWWRQHSQVERLCRLAGVLLADELAAGDGERAQRAQRVPLRRSALPPRHCQVQREQPEQVQRLLLARLARRRSQRHAQSVRVVRVRVSGGSARERTGGGCLQVERAHGRHAPRRRANCAQAQHGEDRAQLSLHRHVQLSASAASFAAARPHTRRMCIVQGVRRLREQLRGGTHGGLRHSRRNSLE